MSVGCAAPCLAAKVVWGTWVDRGQLVNCEGYTKSGWGKRRSGILSLTQVWLYLISFPIPRRGHVWASTGLRPSGLRNGRGSRVPKFNLP